MIKRHVVREILRDFFRIMSHGIYFSSLGISKTSDKIGEISDKIVEKAEKAVECSLFSKFENGKGEIFSAYYCHFFLEGEKTWPFLSFGFNISISKI